MKKAVKPLFIISFLLLILVYVSNITNLPDKIILFQGEKYSLKIIPGLEIEAVETSSNFASSIEEQTSGYSKDVLQKMTSEELTSTSSLENGINKIGKIDYKLSLFGSIPLKDISVSVIPKTYVVPLGNAIGLKLYTNGVLVVGMSEINGKKPYENTGIEEGDMIVNVNNTTVTCTAELINAVNKAGQKEIEIEYIRNGEKLQTSIMPVEAEDNMYKLGLWVRDAAAGVGTVSFYEPKSGMFAALGHGIQDVDTQELLTIAKGDFITTKILSITKGTKGNPGRLQGSIDNQTTLGEIYKNTEFGIYGKLTNVNALNINANNAIEVAGRDEITTGEAKIICTLDNNVKKEYKVEIERIYKNNNDNNKSMLIKIVDKDLIEKTGGIIQGMSGSPIIQNGKLVGALTHVLVNNPEMGYGVFADLMIKQMSQ